MGPAPAHSLRLGIRPLLAAGAAATLCACSSVPDVSPLKAPPVAASPVSQHVEQASRARGAFPTFASIPQPPTDVRPTRAWSRSIYDMLRLRRQMIVEAAMAPPAPADTEQFAAGGRASVADPGSPSAAAAALDNKTATFVEGGRERATPPSSAR